MRNYESDIVERVKKCGWENEPLGDVGGLPLLRVTVETWRGLPTVYVNGGTHGDEPSGTEAVLRFLEGRVDRWTDRFRFDVIPCLNPSGYEAGTRENSGGVDLNWAYSRTDLPEIAALHRFLVGR